MNNIFKLNFLPMTNSGQPFIKNVDKKIQTLSSLSYNPEERFIFKMNTYLIINDSMNFVYDIFHKRKND